MKTAKSFVGQMQSTQVHGILEKSGGVTWTLEDSGPNVGITIQGPSEAVDRAMEALERWIDEDEED